MIYERICDTKHDNLKNEIQARIRKVKPYQVNQVKRVIEGQKGEERWVIKALGPPLDSLLGSWSSNLVSDFARL